jgi:succinyl-CoA synthetase beta subunit
MNLHEYQAKEILKGYGIPVPLFGVAATEAEAHAVVEQLGLEEAVVKIQVHAGGRGKAGGVQFAKTRREIMEVAKHLIGMKMVNRQTGPEGVVAKCVLISQPVEIAQEFYLGAAIDRNHASPILIASPQGGMEIEEIAHQTPDKILTLPFFGSLRSYQLIHLEKFMGWGKEGGELAQQLCRCFLENDASMVEINPLILDRHQRLIALDAKMSIDDNALFRHPELSALFDPNQLSPQEAMAKEHDLAYIAMHGTIGCMVNGAGLAMATMDIIQFYGGAPANFLDVGGSASKEKIAAGFQIILSDPKVQAVLINIFGGIMNCAILAEGVIQAAEEMQIHCPIVVRLEGTNVEQGRRLFAESRLTFTVADDLADAAQKVVRMGK